MYFDSPDNIPESRFMKREGSYCDFSSERSNQKYSNLVTLSITRVTKFHEALTLSKVLSVWRMWCRMSQGSGYWVFRLGEPSARVREVSDLGH